VTPGEQPESTEKTDGDDEAVSGMLPRWPEGDRLELKASALSRSSRSRRRASRSHAGQGIGGERIGRPSTYASIIGVLQYRDYVNQAGGSFQAERALACSSAIC